MRLIYALFAALTALLGSHDGFAQSAYPDKAIRILVGFPPGGPPDIAARLLADRFADAWGKPVLVENATGAGGNVAVDRAAKAVPDGYTLVMASSAITINEPVRKAAVRSGQGLGANLACGLHAERPCGP